MTCQDVEDYPFKIARGVGSNMGSFPVICAGLDGSPPHANQCNKFVEGRWQQFANLTHGY